MLNAFKLLLVFVLSFIVMYLMGCFILLEWDITQWSQDARITLVSCSVTFTIIVGYALLVEYLD
jgi:hypothetical protein